MCFTPLNCALKNGSDGNFCVIYVQSQWSQGGIETVKALDYMGVKFRHPVKKRDISKNDTKCRKSEEEKKTRKKEPAFL